MPSEFDKMFYPAAKLHDPCPHFEWKVDAELCRQSGQCRLAELEAENERLREQNARHWKHRNEESRRHEIIRTQNAVLRKDKARLDWLAKRYSRLLTVHRIVCSGKAGTLSDAIDTARGDDE